MKIFEKIQSKDIDELARWLDVNATFDNTPWIEFFDTKYCKNCEPEIVKKDCNDYHCDMKFGWCELHDKCRYFQELDEAPDNVQMIKMWLESECED